MLPNEDYELSPGHGVTATRKVHILDLPAELRYMIFEYVFSNVIILPVRRAGCYTRSESTYNLHIFPAASLLLVSRFFYRDALHLFWQSATLDLNLLKEPWLSTFKPGQAWFQNQLHITKLCVRTDFFLFAIQGSGIRKDLPQFSGLQRLFQVLMRGGLRHIWLRDNIYDFPKARGPEDCYGRLFIRRVLAKFCYIRKEMPRSTELILQIPTNFKQDYTRELEKAADEIRQRWKDMDAEVVFIGFISKVATFKFRGVGTVEKHREDQP